MTKRVYRTAQGRTVDLGRLQLQNEHVRAVGNMGVNARGDLVDSNNRAIKSRNQDVGGQYRRQIAKQVPPPQSKTTSPAAPVKPVRSAKSTRAPKPEVVPEIPAAPEDFQDDFVKEPEAAPEAVAEPNQGLAAAIARARQVKQDPLKTPRQLAQQSDGVRKI